MAFGLFRDEGLKEFSKGLARELAVRLPADTLDAERVAGAKFKSTLTRALQHTFLSVQAYARERGLGILKKASLSKVFQDELVVLGYPKEFAREAALALAEQLTQI